VTKKGSYFNAKVWLLPSLYLATSLEPTVTVDMAAASAALSGSAVPAPGADMPVKLTDVIVAAGGPCRRHRRRTRRGDRCCPPRQPAAAAARPRKPSAGGGEIRR
jgi:hypothetical protein